MSDIQHSETPHGERISRAMVTRKAQDLQGFLYPLFSGVRNYARENKIDTTKGVWVLTMAWQEEE